jgi:hypothetical protein
MTPCCECFTDFLAQCPDEIQVYAQLQPATMYTWVITDKFGKQYSAEFTTDAEGFWNIPVDELPAGLLTEYSGDFKLTVLDQACKPTKFKVAQEYTCIDFHVVGGTRIKNNLGCSFDSAFTGSTFASVSVDTFADALAEMTGNQFKYILVANDEDKGELNQSYFYVPGFAELIYLGAAIPNSET